MKIIHYCLGIPPFATGGLTIYAHDLALAQMKNHEVHMLYPGYKKSEIVLKKIKNKENISLYRIDGLLPVSLTYGVKNPFDFIGHKDMHEIANAFKEIANNADILHLHTIQGLYPEIIEYFKKCGVKIILTTHDFYSFSLTTKLYKVKELNDKLNIIQSIKAPKTNVLYLNRRPIINKLKHIKFIKHFFNKKVKEEKELAYDNEYATKYLLESSKLYSFYKGMINQIDLIHANSQISNEVYSKVYNNVKTVYISHSGISKHEVNKNKNSFLNIGFFGEQTREKGFNLLLDVLDDLYKENCNFYLNCYGHSNLYERPYMTYHGAYNFNDLEDIYKDLDLVVFPAENIESFGFIVLEAISYNTPVIVTNTVGAKSICNKDFIVNDRMDLKNLLQRIIADSTILNNYFNYVVDIKTIDEHSLEVEKELYS